MTQEPHPCSGVWIEAAPFRGQSLRSLRKAERTARDAGAVGWVIPEGTWMADAVDGFGESAIRIDLRRGARDSALPSALERALEVEPDLIGLPVHDLEQLPPGALGANERLVARAAEDEVDVILLARGTPEEAEAVAAFAAGHEPVLGVSVETVDEEALEFLSRDESLCVLAPGTEFATAYRHGAGGIDHFLGLLSPAAAVALLELSARDVTAALDVERRLQHFVETHIEPARRRLDGSEAALGALLVALGDWCPKPPAHDALGTLDVDTIRDALQRACPEMASSLGRR